MSTFANDPRYTFWIAAIKKEFDSICYAHSVKLDWPILELVAYQKSFWGKWDPNYKKLTLHQDLFLHHPWEIIREILKHEMAHMLVSAKHGDIAHSHGKEFLYYCRVLGMEEWSKSATIDLNSNLKATKAQLHKSANSSALRKVQKLLALSNSANENEAKIALQKATEIMEKNALASWQIHQEKHICKSVIQLGKKRVDAYLHEILHILKTHFQVEVILVDSFDPIGCNPIKTAELIGSVENLRFAEFVFQFLKDTVVRLWNRHKKMTGVKGLRFKNSYYHGVLERISANLSAMKDIHSKPKDSQQENKQHLGNSQKSSTTLLALHREELQLAFDYFFPKISNSYRKRTYDKDSYEAGQKDGNEVNIKRPISGDRRNTKLLTT